MYFKLKMHLLSEQKSEGVQFQERGVCLLKNNVFEENKCLWQREWLRKLSVYLNLLFNVFFFRFDA